MGQTTHWRCRVIIEITIILQETPDKPCSDRVGLFLTYECVATLGVLEDDGWCLLYSEIDVHFDDGSCPIPDLPSLSVDLAFELRGIVRERQQCNQNGELTMSTMNERC